jgi:hypothetical protein
MKEITQNETSNCQNFTAMSHDNANDLDTWGSTVNNNVEM